MITSNDGDRVATLPDLARIFDVGDWPIWDRADCPVPDNDQWEPHLVVLRLMWTALTKSKAELLETAARLCREASPDDGVAGVQKLVEGAESTEALLRDMLVIIGAGRARLTAAAAKFLEESDDRIEY